jgi:predicted RNase H-like nuclease (RuvC/YqgF family)
MEENKKTSKEILPEEVRQEVKQVQKAEADLYPSSYLLKYVFFPMLDALEAAEREVEEKEDIIEQMQLDDVYQQDDIRSKRADIEFLENKLKEKADEFLNKENEISNLKKELFDTKSNAHFFSAMYQDMMKAKDLEINELKREIEELKSRINID